MRFFEGRIAAVDTNIAAFQQSLTQAIVHGTSTFKPGDIGKAIRKLHADRKELEFRSDDWRLNLNTALSRAAGVGQQKVPAPQPLPARDGKIQEVAGTKGGAQIWHGLHLEFKALAKEELRRDPTRGIDGFGLSLTRNDETGEDWHLSAGVDEGFRARFEVLAARAGITLGAQVMSMPPLEFWLHALFENLLEHRSAELFAANKETGGIILRVCEASATHCARLEKTALAQPLGSCLDARKRREWSLTKRVTVTRLTVQIRSERRQPPIEVAESIGPQLSLQSCCNDETCSMPRRNPGLLPNGQTAGCLKDLNTICFALTMAC